MKKIQAQDSWLVTEEQRELYARIKGVDFQHLHISILRPEDFSVLFDEVVDRICGDRKKGYAKYLTQRELGVLLGGVWATYHRQLLLNEFHAMTLYKLCAWTNTTFSIGDYLPIQNNAYTPDNQGNAVSGTMMQDGVLIHYKLEITGKTRA